MGGRWADGTGAGKGGTVTPQTASEMVRNEIFNLVFLKMGKFALPKLMWKAAVMHRAIRSTRSLVSPSSEKSPVGLLR